VGVSSEKTKATRREMKRKVNFHQASGQDQGQTETCRKKDVKKDNPCRLYRAHTRAAKNNHLEKRKLTSQSARQRKRGGQSDKNLEKPTVKDERIMPDLWERRIAGGGDARNRLETKKVLGHGVCRWGDTRYAGKR